MKKKLFNIAALFLLTSSILRKAWKKKPGSTCAKNWFLLHRQSGDGQAC
ncbi:MAG: hypothetical protein IPO07_29500 [Haliscomenobacter sp.]|nr:hypothetical protein [Haliscomenobacter sp.]MBK9492465.1 hypothetical protein [Haliscomenobacter sp.]